MSGSYQTSFDSGRSPINNSPASASSTLAPDSFKTNLNRTRSKRWVEAAAVNYDDLWGDGDDYDSGSDDDYRRGARLPDRHAPVSHTEPVARSPASAAPAPAASADSPLPHGMKFPPPPSEIDMVLPPTPSEIGGRESTKQAPSAVHVGYTSAPPQQMNMGPSSPQPLGHRAMSTIYTPSPSVDSAYSQKLREELQKRLSVRKPVPSRSSLSSSPASQASSQQPLAAYPPNVPPLSDSSGGHYVMEYQGQYGHSPNLPAANDQPPLQSPPGVVNLRATGFPVPQSTPDYERYESPSSLCGRPKSADKVPLRPLILPTSQQPSSFSVEPMSTSPTSSSNPRIIRPSDIYRRHQEEQMRQSSVDSTAVGGVGSSLDEQRHPTRGESMRIQRSSEADSAPLLLRALASQEDVRWHASSQQWSEQTSAASPSPPARPRSRSGGSLLPSPLQPPANPLPNVPSRLVSPSGGSSPSSPLSRSESIHSPSPHPPPVAPLSDVRTPPSLPATSWSRPQPISGFALQTERASSTDLPSAILSPQGGLDEPEEKNCKTKDPLPGTLPPEDNAYKADRGEAEKVVDAVPKAAPLDGINTDYTPTKNSGDTEEKYVGSPVANDVIYETPLETIDHQDYFTPPTGQSRLPSTTNIPLARGSGEPGCEVFQTLVDHAFIRQDTLVPTPYSETPSTEMSPILPPPPASPKDYSGDDVSSPAAPPAIMVQNFTSSATEKDLASAEKVNARNPSPGSLREGVNKFSVALPPVHTEAITGELLGTTPVSGISSPHETPVSEESDELDHFIGELERAQTPVSQSPSITPTPSEHATTYPKSSTWQDPNRLSTSHSPNINPTSQDELEEHRRSPGQDQSFFSDSRSLSMKSASLHEEEDRPLSTQKERGEPGAPSSPRIDSPLHEEPEKHLQTSAEVRNYSDAPRSPGITSNPPGEATEHVQPSAPVYDHLGVSISTEDKTVRDSLGVLSMYGSYWRDGDEDSVGGAPLPVPPKSPRRVAAAEGPSPMAPSPQDGLISQSEFEVPEKSSLPPPVTISPSQETDSAMPAEPQTPASILDQDLLELVSTGKRFLDRRDTVLVPREEPRREEDKVTPQRSPAGPEPGGIEAIHFTKNLGPESEGIEAIGGPIVEKRPKAADELNSPAENDFTRELLSQFSRPQTLMLKQTMPSGIVMMPPMSPAPGGKSPADESAPEVVNFEKDYGEGIEILDDVAPDDRKVPPSDKTVAAKMSTAVIQDTRLIAALDGPEERIMAYDALRDHIRESPNPLADWISYQLEHNSGNELLESEIVSIKPCLAPRKSKSRMGGLGHFPSRSGDGGSRHEEGAANRAEEKLEKMGRGAMRLGEMAGGRVGGWVKRVGKKGNSNKESTSETADHQMRDGSSIELDTAIGNRTRNASATSHSSAAVPERSTSIGSMSQHTLTPTASSSPVNHPPPHPHIQTQFQPKPVQAPQVRPSLQSVNEPKQPTLSIHHQPSIARSKSPSLHSVKSPPAPGPAYSPYPARKDSPSSPDHRGSSSVITARGVPLPLSAEDSPSASTPPLPGPAAKAAADERQGCSDDDSDFYSIPKRPVVESQEQKPPLSVVAAAPPVKESQDMGDGLDTINTELHAAPDQLLGCETAVQDQDSMMRVRQSMPLVPRGMSPISPLTVTPTPPQLQVRGLEDIVPPPLPQQDVSQRLSVIAVPPSPNPEVAHSDPQPNQQGPHGAENAQRTPSVAHSQGHSPQSGQQVLGHGDQGPILQDPHAAKSQQFPGPLPPPHPETQQPQHQQQPPFSSQHPAPPQTAHGHPAPPPSRGSTLAQTISNGSGHPSGSSSSNSGKRVKRASLFGGLGSKQDGMGRSVSAASHPQPQPQQWQKPRQQQQHYPQGQPQGRPRGYSQDHHQAHSPPIADAPPQKMTKRGSFLKKLGGSKPKKQDESAKPKGNRVFSDIFSRTSSPPNSTGSQPSNKLAKLAKARLVSGGSDGTQAPAQPSSSEPKIYDPKTGQYMSFDQAISRSGSMQSRGVPQQPLGPYVSPSQEYAPPRPSIGGHSQHSGYQSPSATYPQGVPQQQLVQQQEMQRAHSPAANVQSRHSSVLLRQSGSYAPPSPGQQPPPPISRPLQQSGHEETRQGPGTPYRQPSQMAHGVPHQGMSPPPPPGNQHYQPKEQPQAHTQNYPDHNRYGASPQGLQQQQQYHQYPHNQSPYAASPTHPHPAYQQQPSYQPEYQPPSGAPQLPPLPSGLVRQSTQSSLYNAVLAHRGSIAERRAANTPPPPSQHHQPTQFQQPTYPHSQEPSPQLSRAGTGVSSVSGGELAKSPSQQQQPYAPPPRQELSYSPPPQLHEEQQHYPYTPRPPSAARENSGYAGYTSPVIPPPSSAATASYHRSPPPLQQEQLEQKQSVASNVTRASGHAAPLFPQQPLTLTQSPPMPQRAQSVISISTSVSGLSSGPGISRQGTHHSSLAHGVSSPHGGMSVNADTPASTGTPAAVIFVDSTNAGPGALLGSPANSVVYESAQKSDRYPAHSSDRPAEDEPVTTELKAKVEQGTSGKEGDLDIKKREQEQDAEDETIGKGKEETKVPERVEEQVEDYQGVRAPDTQHDKQEIQVQHGIQDEQAGQVAKFGAIAGEASKEPAPNSGQEQPIEDKAAMGKHPSTTEPEEAAEPTAAVIEEKIAVHYESNDGKEVVSAGHQRGGGSDGEGYSMSSTAYPGTWEPAYYGWS